MQRNKDTAPLMKNRLFKGIDPSRLKMKLRQNNFLSFREGDIIFQKGDAGENIFLIIEGEVKLKAHSAENGTSIFRKGKNDFFGELELFDKVPRNSSAIANTDCVLYTLSRKELYELISADKSIKKNINSEEIESDEPGIEGEEITEEAIREEAVTSDEPEEIMDDSLLQEDILEMPDENIDSAIHDFNLENKIETPGNEFIEEGITLNDSSDDLEETKLNEQIYDENSDNIFKLNSDETFFHDEPGPADEGIQKSDEFDLEKNIPEHNSNDNLFVEPEAEMPEISLPSTEALIDYKKISQAVRKIYSGRGLENTARSAVETLIDLFDAQIIRIFISENKDGELWSYPFMDNSEEIKKVKSGEGLVGGAAITREVINLNEPTFDARYNPQFDSVENILIEDMLIYPIMNEGGNLVAVIQMINSGKNGFTSTDIEMLSLLSLDISTAISTARESSKSMEDNNMEKPFDSANKTIEDEYMYFSKTSKFLASDLKASSSLLVRYLDFIRKKSEAEEIKDASGLALQQAEIILKEAGVVSDFINGKSALKKETAGIRKILDDTLEMLAEYVEQRKSKLFKKCLTDASVNIDRHAFYIAFFQVIKNACEAMPQGGSIYVTCEKEENSLRFEIKDSGIGISEDIKGKIFDPFFAFPENKPGLGLSIASKIIKDHGGELKLNYGVSDGASFIITLPAAA